NMSVSRWVALDDSDVGSANPLADRLLATGKPKMASAAVSRAATATTRRGAAMASRAICCSRSDPSFVDRLYVDDEGGTVGVHVDTRQVREPAITAIWRGGCWRSHALGQRWPPRPSGYR